jgi:ketosteroid isomerase-like protein
MYGRIFLAVMVCAALSFSPAAAESFDAVFQAETEFDAFTHAHGYTKGFFTYSAPDAIAFDGAGAIRIHDKLVASLAKDDSEKDAPSKLRWRPYRVAAAASGDLAYDLGPWTIEGTDKAGWFLTLWQKQADGRWLWVLDTGAGPAGAKPAPVGGAYEISRIDGTAPDPNAAAEVDGLDAALNTALKTQPADKMYKERDLDYLIVASDGAPPARDKEAALAALATRPAGLVWTQDGKAIAADGRFAYTYGHATASGGAYQGHYVRVWVKMGLKPTDWTQSVDLYQSGK